MKDEIRRKRPGVFAASDSSSFSLPPSSFGSYTAFIHWPFQRENTPLGRAKEWDEKTYGPFDDSTNEDILKGRVVRMAGAHEYLKTLAIARLFLDNVPSLQASWVTMGPKIGQLALMFGANDMGSVMIEENVVRAAGASYCMDELEIVVNIEDAGFIPKRRNMHYEILGDPIFRERDVPRMLSLATARVDGDSSTPEELRNYPARSREGKRIRLSQ
jgi:2-iminoacetate synthase ThiH